MFSCLYNVYYVEVASVNLSFSGAFLKITSLVLLTAQNAVFILSMRYVRTRGGDMFFTTTAVILQEAIKCFMSLIIILVQVGCVHWDCLRNSVSINSIVTNRA